MVRISLGPDAREELRRLLRAPDTAPATRDRLEMVRLSSAGFAVKRIADEVGAHTNTVYKTLRAFRRGGFAGLVAKTSPGRPRTVSEEHLIALERLLQETQRTWTSFQLCEWLVQRYGVRVSAGWLSQVLRRRGFAYKRTKHSVQHKADPVLQQAKQAELEALKKGGKGGRH